MTYDFGGQELIRYAKAQIAKVQEYLSYDPDIEVVLIDAYTDSYDRRSINQKISEKMTYSVKEFFISAGITQ